MGLACGGRCAVFLVAALVLDAAGLALVLAGAAGKPMVAGCSLEEFLVLSGVLLLFLSLLCWLFWYSGNLRGVPAEELPIGARPSSPAPPPPPRGHASLVRLAAKLSKRLSQRRRLAPAASCPPDPGRSAAAPTSAAAAAAAAPAAAAAAALSSPLELSHLHPQQGTPGERLV